MNVQTGFRPDSKTGKKSDQKCTSTPELKMIKKLAKEGWYYANRGCKIYIKNLHEKTELYS